MVLRSVRATRYVTPLREGGSLPGLVEADDLGVDFLPGSFGYDGVSFRPDAYLAATVLWFDALVGNVDRGWRNPNLLVWHRALWCIDHGATLTFQYRWSDIGALAAAPYDISGHVFAEFAHGLADVGVALASRISPPLLAEVSALVPDSWLPPQGGMMRPSEVRNAFAERLLARARTWRSWS